MSIANEELRSLSTTRTERKSAAAQGQRRQEADHPLPSNRRRPSAVIVRLNREAAQIIEALAKKTEQEKSKIASAIIEQGSKIIEFYPAMCVGCEYQDQCEYENGGACLVEEQEDAE